MKYENSFGRGAFVSTLIALVACGADDRDPMSVTSRVAPEPTTSSEVGDEIGDMAAESEEEAAPSDPEAVDPASTTASESGMEGAPDDVDLEQPSAEPEVDPGSEEPTEPTELVPAEEGAPVPSAGCGSAAAVESGRFGIDVAGNEREYILALPDDYDATRPYRLVFTWHPGGGTAQGTANNYYGLRALAEDSAIFVSPEGIDNGWANTGGRDLAFLDAMLDRFRSELCVDETRLFSTGFSYGGMMSLAIGCGRADEFRAIAPMSGALFSGCEDGDAPVAMLGFHGTSDTVVSLNAGVNARNVIAGRNGCQPAAMAIESDDGCLAFQGCTESLTWCEFDGGHRPAPQSAGRIWDFFSGF